MMRPLSILVLLAAFLLLPGCETDDGDNDDNNNDDESPADDDNDDADDDDNDNDDNDDDNDDDTSPSDEDRLVVFGQTESAWATWVQTDKGWEMQAIPAPPETLVLKVLHGPVVIADGAAGYSIWNKFHTFAGVGGYFYTAGNIWLAYDAADGWREAEEIPAAQPRRFVHWFGYPEGGSLWAYAEYLVGMTIPMQGTMYDQNLNLLQYQGGAPVEVFNFSDYGITAIDLPTANTGLMQVANASLSMYEYDGADWQPFATPDGFEDGFFTAFELDDADNGYALWWADDRMWLVEISAGVWTKRQMPPGCNNLPPNGYRPDYLARQGDHIVAYDAGRDHRLVEKRGGEWLCRSFEGPEFDDYIQNAIPYGGEFVYVAIGDLIFNAKEPPRLLRFDAAGYEELSLPADLVLLWGVWMTGPTAPPRQIVPGDHYTMPSR